MSNSYTSSPTLVNPGRVTAARTIRATEISRLGDLSNYCFAMGGTSNVLSQAWDDSTFRQDDSSAFVSMCQWYIPALSSSHQSLNIVLSAWCNTAGGEARFVLDYGGGNTYTTDITITDTSRYSSGFNTGTITLTSTQNEFAAVLTMGVRAPVGDEVEVLSVMAYWSSLPSPLPTGQLFHTLSAYNPQGINRLAADLPLSARFGVEMLENINTLRRRPRVLFSWSGVEGVSSGDPIADAGAVPRAIGSGDLPSMFSECALFPGMVEDSTLNIFAYVNVKQNGGTFAGYQFDLFGQRISCTSAGWSTFTLNLRESESDRSTEFGLSMYRVGPDNTVFNTERFFVFGKDMDGLRGVYVPYLAGLTIVGV
jgi:hypothetical protein